MATTASPDPDPDNYSRYRERLRSPKVILRFSPTAEPPDFFASMSRDDILKNAIEAAMGDEFLELLVQRYSRQ